MMKARRLALSLLGASAALAPTAALSLENPTYRYNCPQLVGGYYDDTYFNATIFQGQNGWFFRREADLRDFYRLGPNAIGRLTRLNAALKRLNTTLVYVPLPVRGVVASAHVGSEVKQPVGFDLTQALEEHRFLLKQLQQAGIETVDLTPTFEGNPQRSELWYERDVHWKPEGARDAARLVAEKLSRLDATKDASRAEYKSQRVDTKVNDFRMPLAIQRFCVEMLPLEPMQVFESSTEASSATDLFGDDATTPVAVVGTSYTGIPEFNFDGFLSEFSGLSVANYAIRGGGAFLALLNFSHTPSVRERPPKVLVWENPIYNQLDREGDLYLRQIIPALHGPCSTENRVAHATGGGSSARLNLPETVRPAGHAYYVTVKLRSTDARTARLRLNYDVLDGETIDLRRSPLLSGFDSFYWELADDVAGSLRSVDVELPQGAEIEELALCRDPGGQKS